MGSKQYIEGGDKCGESLAASGCDLPFCIVESTSSPPGAAWTLPIGFQLLNSYLDH